RTHHPSTSPVDTYRPAVTQATYERLAQVAERLLEAKCPVIVDATFLRQQHRLKFFRMAQRLDVPFCILNVTAPESVRSQRIEARQQEGRDASEATVAVMQRQVQQDEPFAPDERDFVISVDSTNDDSVQSTIRQLSQWISSNR
ncbi:MAG: ATP-binding protein, partial [Nitrospira sp.]|nr:ATP-binding protein [Nitrospira sp.]